MKVTVMKGKEKMSIDTACLPAWKAAGWTEEKEAEKQKASK